MKYKTLFLLLFIFTALNSFGQRYVGRNIMFGSGLNESNQ